MGMYVYVKVEDLTHAIPHLAGLSFDKSEDADTLVVVSHNMCLAKGHVEGDQVSFGVNSRADIIAICTRVGIPFGFW